MKPLGGKNIGTPPLHNLHEPIMWWYRSAVIICGYPAQLNQKRPMAPEQVMAHHAVYLRLGTAYIVNVTFPQKT